MHLALADSANDEGVCWPKLDTLSVKVRLKDYDHQQRSARKILSAMKADGHIAVEILQTGGGRGKERGRWLIHVRNPESGQWEGGFSPETRNGETGFITETRNGMAVNSERDGSPPTPPYKEEPSLNRHKPSSEPDGSDGLSLHGRIRTFIQEKYLERFQIKCQWDGSEATQLKKLIAANPSWGFEDYKRMVKNRFASTGTNGDRPRMWLKNLSKYVTLLNEFGRSSASAAPLVDKTPDLLEQVRKQRG